MIEEQWIRYADCEGLGYAQPDFYLVGPHSVVVFEAKLTQREDALLQIGQLYRPLLRYIYGRPVVGVMVYRNAITTPATPIKHPTEVLDIAADYNFTWHYLT